MATNDNDQKVIQKYAEKGVGTCHASRKLSRLIKVLLQLEGGESGED